MPRKNTKTVMPDHLPNGEVLTDIAKKKWCLGNSIGVGGFGEIYSAAEFTPGNKTSLDYKYVIKIEPHGNGPLFCEMHFFMRNAKPEMIKAWCDEKKIPILGMPQYLGSGSHEHNGKKYRFLVMEKFGEDLWKIFLENKKKIPFVTVYRIALQLLDVLEYIHSNGYIHADIKGANILLSASSSAKKQVYLVDFGLASHFTKKEFKPDPKKAHNGTIEYTSRDAHEGVPTRRSDIEILAYNIVHWLGATLPWEKNLGNPVAVHNSKKESMSNITKFLNTCFKPSETPVGLKEFLEYVSNMKYDTEPDYDKLRSILKKAIKSINGTLNGALEFKSPQKRISQGTPKSVTPKKKKKMNPIKKAKSEEEETSKRRGRKTPKKSTNDEDENPNLENKNGNEGETNECNEDLFEDSNTESPLKKLTKTKSKVTASKTRNRKVQNIETDTENETPVKDKGNKKMEKSPLINGYNAEMMRLQKKIAQRKTTKTEPKKNKNSEDSNSDVIDGTPENSRFPKRKRTPANYAELD